MTRRHTMTAHTRSPGWLALLLALAVLTALAGPAMAQDKKMTDQQIADAIENEFLFDRAVPANEIDVSVSDGVVALTGSVGNILAKDRASRLAETVRGVRSVVNRLSVAPASQRAAAVLKRDVKTALLTDAATESYEVDVEADEEGKIVLTGTVDSWTEKQLAGKVAKGVKGVTALSNKINVEYKQDRPDGEIAAEVRKALRWDTLVDHGLITVAVSDGEVTLSGVVGSAAEKRRAAYDAWVSGVEAVNDEGLDVQRWARDEDLRKDKYQVKSADEIKSAINDALLYDPRVLSFNVKADVAGSTVTLRGEVDNLRAKQAAAQVARHTVGVTAVTNRIKVRPAEDIEDARVAESVSEALLRDPYVDRFDITVTVVNGTAYLNGTVDSYFEKSRAHDIASGVGGVTEVRNALNVDYPGPLAYDPYVYDDYVYGYEWYDYTPTYTFETDAEIRDDIQSELWWSPFVDSDEVTVTVEDGVATLTGTVESWSERTSALENAYEGGAVWVDNNLTVGD